MSTIPNTFIKAEYRGGNKILINPQYVVYIEPSGSVEGAKIYLADGGILNVKNSIDDFDPTMPIYKDEIIEHNKKNIIFDK